MYKTQYKMKSKTKAKKPSRKLGKVTPTEISTSSDLSQLRPPVDTSISTLYRVSKVLETGSDEVKSILAFECDLIYECRICQSLFRSLANFISHKRVYCKKKFDVTFAKNSPNDSDIIPTNNLDAQKEFEEVGGNDRILRSQVCKEKEKKDLSTVVDMLRKKQVGTNTERLYLETVHSNSSAVYQTVESVVSSESSTDLMKAQVTELESMSEQTAVLDQNGQVSKSTQKLNNNTATQVCNNKKSDSVLENELICPICCAKFSTKKTLTVHTRTLHTSHRLCYPCPCCSNTFANTWSVYRHLFKVHKKSNEEVRKLRSQIQEKAFIRNTTVAEDLQKEDANKISANNALRVNETQEWIDHLESDTELQRCGGCGKRFDRKAALSAHLQYCHRRVAAYESTIKVKKINKVPSNSVSNENTVVNSESNNATQIDNTNLTSIRVEAINSLSKADWNMLSSEKSNGNVLTNGEQGNKMTDNLSSASEVSDPLEIVYTNINKHKVKVGSRKRKNKDNTKRLNNNTENIKKDISLEVSIGHNNKKTEKPNHVLLMEKKIASIVNFEKLQCLPCKRKFPSVNNLRRHAAIHIGWNRYQCKLCDYKCFVKCDCIAHCNKIHNAQNNRVVIDEMITQIPDDQYMCNESVMSNGMNLGKETDVPEVVEVNISAENMEVEVEIEKENVNEIKTEADKNSVMTYENGETEETLNNNIKGNTLELNPDLKRMVMEVIFGSPETHSTKQTDAKETESSNSQLRNREEETQFKNSNLKESTCTQDNLKTQRPIRNKIKPLNKDFIYDLKEVTFRKDPLIMKSFNKQLAKKSPVQEEDNLEKIADQPSKRFKAEESDEISILCETNTIVDTCEIKHN
ncbi:zinc finger protein 800 isoform X2 [Frieseomelitta varia]|nr:zinc finger protein 800 isoform X2 [Frieseomelitta varia]XP_043511293.1 zinc finger protein 800 isoform X2 [Frieseomelitta varia]XP_043511303.1 zinc finger protein 800 isoform X2 [Frieseomelitta varia]XP_043511309.1 zinc finger protein 800 isoform X2 [Frieseomelitta varia]